MARFFLVVVLAAGLVSCSAYKDIRLTSCEVITFVPKGLTAVDAVLGIGVDNPAPGFTVSDIEASVVFNGTPCASVTAGSVTLEGRRSEVYEVPCTISLTGRIPILALMSALGEGDLSGLKIDGSARVSRGNGKGRRIEIDDLEIDRLLEGVNDIGE